MFICLDLETTGLNPKTDRVIEVAIALFDHEKVIEKWSSLVNPGVPIPEFTKKLTHIDDAMVKDAPTLEELKQTILEKIGDHPILGHFIFFDVNFLKEHGFDLKNTTLDTCQLAQVLLPKEPSYSLEVFSKKLSISQEDAHRALDDVLANVHLAWKLLEHVKSLDEKAKEKIRPILEKSVWTWAPFVLEVLDQAGQDRIPETAFQKAKISQQKVNLTSLVSNLKSPLLLEEATHTTSDLVTHAKALSNKACLVLENLQNLPEDEDLAVLKSASEYLDEGRFNLFLDKTSLNPEQTLLALKIALWSLETQKGEQSELRLHKEEKALWYDICGEENGEPTSFYKKAIQATEKKPIMVLSHLAFLRDRCKAKPSVQLPETVLIGDCEQLVFEIEEAWQIRLNERRLLHTLRRIKDENPSEEELLDALASRVSILFGFLGIFIERNGTPEDDRHTIILEAHHRNTLEWTKVSQSSKALAADLAGLGDRLKPSASLEELSKLFHYLEKILGEFETILWLTQDMEGNPIINAFPEDCSEIFSKRVWAGIQTLQLFSHSAKTQNSFQFLKSELGLPEELTIHEEERSSFLQIEQSPLPIPNPNDPQNISKVLQSLKALLPNLAADIFLLVSAKNTAEQFFYKLPKLLESPDVQEKKFRLFVQNLGGGMGKIHQMSQETLGRNLFVGNENFLRFLIDEGMDLKTLLIHRLPFAVPSDPIQKSRAAHYQDPYKEFSLPQAILNLNSLIHLFLGEKGEEKRIFMLDSRYENLFL